MEAALKVRVYVGPSLPLHEARPILNADYRPPLRAADLPIACAAGVDVVVILDGAFIQATTASVSQIALCLERGMRVYGAASAGALRAVECKRLGMIGVGEIYRLFESGFEDEDELAVTFDPETGRCLSWPMVNVRNACRRAFEDQIISRDDADRIEAVAKSIYFAERTAASVTKSCSAELDSNTLSRFQSYVRTNADKLDLKAADSRACLSTVAAFVNSRQLPVAPADTGWRPTCGPDVSGVLRQLVHTGDERLASELVAVAKAHADDGVFLRKLDLAFGERALRATWSPAALRRWSELKLALGLTQAAAELRCCAVTADS